MTSLIDSDTDDEVWEVVKHARSVCEKVLVSWAIAKDTNDFITGDTMANRLPYNRGILILFMNKHEPEVCEWFRIEFITELMPNIHILWKKESKKYPQPQWNKNVLELHDPNFFEHLKNIAQKAKQ